jgi:hypothetical protein
MRECKRHRISDEDKKRNTSRNLQTWQIAEHLLNAWHGQQATGQYLRNQLWTEKDIYDANDHGYPTTETEKNTEREI